MSMSLPPPPPGKEDEYHAMIDRINQELRDMGCVSSVLTQPMLPHPTTLSPTATGTGTEDPTAGDAGANAEADPIVRHAAPHTHLSNSAPSSPMRGGRSMFERVTGDIPIEKFPYGKPEADWTKWSRRFDRAVQAATNAFSRDRLEELCLIWIALKLPEDTQPIYSKCVYKDNEWRDYIEESIPYGKESIDMAYNQALKYKHKIANKKVDFTGAAMTDSEKNDFKKMQLDMAEVQSKLERQEAEKAKWRDRYENRRSRGTDRW